VVHLGGAQIKAFFWTWFIRLFVGIKNLLSLQITGNRKPATPKPSPTRFASLLPHHQS
jgi:hypothetical protein